MFEQQIFEDIDTLEFSKNLMYLRTAVKKKKVKSFKEGNIF